MNTCRTYDIRQRILQTAKEIDPAAVGLDDLQCSAKMRGLRPTLEELNRELNYLAGTGFLAPIADSNGEYCHITASGLDQAGPQVEVARDIRIWGKAAL